MLGMSIQEETSGQTRTSEKKKKYSISKISRALKYSVYCTELFRAGRGISIIAAPNTQMCVNWRRFILVF